MTHDASPVWMLTTSSDARLPEVPESESLSGLRLTELRSALALMSKAPVVTLEAHPLSTRVPRSAGIPLDAASPLARELSSLLQNTSASGITTGSVAGGETLYRMVVPAKFAAQVGTGALTSMKSSTVPTGIYSALTGAAGIEAQAAFVPVATTATAAAGLSVAAIAGPLVVLAIGVGVAAYAENQRQAVTEHITELLEKLHDDALEHERAELEGCQDAIDKATSVLLDEGKVGLSLGLDSAAHTVADATQMARRRAKKWAAALDRLEAGHPDAEAVEKAFPGVEDEGGGEFRAHLELAALAISLKRRINVLQAVEHSQGDPDRTFDNFARSLSADERRLTDLEDSISTVLRRLARLQVRSPRRLLDQIMTRKEVDRVLGTVYRLQDLGQLARERTMGNDMIIDIARAADGSLLVLPASAPQEP